MAISSEPAAVQSKLDGRSSWQQDSREWDRDRVLDYEPQTHRRGLEWQQRFELLWPVHAWRVTVPVGERSRLDPLQRAVLRLRQAGLVELAEIAGKIGVDPELIGYLAAELRDLSYIDELGRVTEDGRFALEDQFPRPTGLRPGWIFQDAVGGHWFPRFTTELRDIDVEADDRGWPVIRRGTRGEPVLDSALVVPARQPSVRPTVTEVLDLLRRHRRDLRRLKRAGSGLTPLLAPAGGRVESIADAPETYHLRTFVYVPRNAEVESQLWFVADPFGFGASPELGRSLEDTRQRQGPEGGLRRRLDLVTGARLQQAREGWQVMNGLLHEEAERTVLERFPDTVPDAEEVRRTLVDGYTALGRARQAANYTPPPRLPAAEIGSVLRRAVELGLQALHRRRPPADAWRRLFVQDGQAGEIKPDHKRTRIAILNESALAVGFGALPKAVRTPNPWKVQEAARHVDSSNLRPKLAAFLLEAVSEADHPIRRLAARAPDWIDRANDLATRTGDVIHGSSRQGPTIEDVEGWAEAALALCCELFDAMVPGEGPHQAAQEARQ